MILKNKLNVEEFSTALINNIAYNFAGVKTPNMVLMVDGVLLTEFGCTFCAVMSKDGKSVQFGYIKLSKIAYAKSKKFNLINAEVNGNILNISDSQVHSITTTDYKEFASFDRTKVDKLTATFNHNMAYVTSVKDKLFNELIKCEKSSINSVDNSQIENERKAAEEAEARRKAAEEAEARRKAAEEEARRKAAEEEARRKKLEEEARQKAAEEEAKRQAAEEIRRQADEAKERRRLAQELAQKKESDLKEEDRRLSKMVTNPSLETKNNLSEYGYIGDEITLESEGAHINIEMNVYVTRFKTNHDMNRIINGDRNNIIRTIVRMLKRGDLKIKGRYQELSNYNISMFRLVSGMIYIRFSLKK